MELTTIQSKIHLLRGARVMLDFDLAELYGIPTKSLKRSVKRNPNRFPPDFMFELTEDETKNLRYQIGTSSWGGTRYAPFAFTEHGVAMLSSVLNSEQAVEINIAIMRAFIAMRQWSLTLGELTDRLKAHDQNLADIEEVLNWLGAENQTRASEIEALRTEKAELQPRRRIGFKPEEG